MQVELGEAAPRERQEGEGREAGNGIADAFERSPTERSLFNEADSRD